MGQDMQKGRRTEIEFLNGFVVVEARRSGLRQGQCRVDRHRQACRTQRAEPGSAAHHRVAAELSRLAPRLPDGRLGAFEMYSPVRSSFIEVDRT
jgi:hypothetical protein